MSREYKEEPRPPQRGGYNVGPGPKPTDKPRPSPPPPGELKPNPDGRYVSG